MIISIRSEVVTLDPSLVPSWVLFVTIDEYFQVALATLLVYHTITTLDKEVKYFWGTRLNPVSVVYFANRYIGILGAIAALGSNFFTWAGDIANWVTIVAIDYILMIRVLALYLQSKRLAYILKTVLGVEAITKFVLLCYIIVAEDVNVARLGPEGPTVCGEGSSAPILIPLGIVDWVIPMVYGVILMALALYKAAQFWRESGGFRGLSLVKVLMVDQVLYFALAVLCCILRILDFKLMITNDFWASLLSAVGSPSFLCVLGSNMLFNLKEAGERGLNQGTTYKMDSRSVSTMEFT